jgi:glycosyltransferase involved in cell wall biosynthesis
VSIVTPLYNNAEHLAQCMESILAQTYQYWDCTIVNNCSTDASAEVASRYAAMDARIHVHHNVAFLPAVVNWNAALRAISPESKYCKIVFADDWIFPECLERMVSLAEEHPSVGIIGAYVLQGDDVTCTGLPYPSTVLSGREVCRLHLLKRVYVFGSPNSVLYRADLVRGGNPFYNETSVHPDDEACFTLLNTCDFGFVHQVLTYTRVREDSLYTRSQQLHTSMGSWLRILVTQGANYLSPEELDSRLRDHLSRYYRFLGKSLLDRESREFWVYHKGQMNEVAIAFSRGRLALGLIGTLIDRALNPKSTVEKLSLRAKERIKRQVRVEREQ